MERIRPVTSEAGQRHCRRLDSDTTIKHERITKDSPSCIDGETVSFFKEMVDFLFRLNLSHKSIFTSEEAAAIDRYRSQIDSIILPKKVNSNNGLALRIEELLADEQICSLSRSNSVDEEAVLFEQKLLSFEERIEHKMQAQPADFELFSALEQYKKANARLKDLNQQNLSQLQDICQEFECYKADTDDKIKRLEYEVKTKDLKIKLFEQEKQTKAAGACIEQNQDSFIKRLSDIQRTRDRSVSPALNSGSKNPERDLRIEQWWNSPEHLGSGSSSEAKRKVRNDTQSNSSLKSGGASQVIDRLENLSKKKTQEAGHADSHCHKPGPVEPSGQTSYHLNFSRHMPQLSIDRLARPAQKSQVSLNIQVKLVGGVELNLEKRTDNSLLLLFINSLDNQKSFISHQMGNRKALELTVSRNLNKLFPDPAQPASSQALHSKLSSQKEACFIIQKVRCDKGSVAHRGVVFVSDFDVEVLSQISSDVFISNQTTLLLVLQALSLGQEDRETIDQSVHLFSDFDLCFDLSSVPAEKRQTVKILGFAKRLKITPQLIG